MKKIKEGKVGSWYLTEIKTDKVHKRLKESTYEQYNERLEKFLRWKKDEIEQEFKRRFKKAPKYSFTITKDGRLLVKTRMNTREEQYLKNILHGIVEDAKKQIPLVNKVVYENVKHALPENVPKRYAPEKMTEVYEYGGKTLYSLHRDAPIKEVQEDYSKIVDLSFRAFKKGVILDPHTGNWTKAEDGTIKYVDFEPHSVTLTRGLFKKNVPQERLALEKFADSLKEMMYFAYIERDRKEGEKMLNYLLSQIKERAYSELNPKDAKELLTEVQLLVKRIKARH